MPLQNDEKLSPVKRRLLQQRLRGTRDRGGLLRQIASSPRPARLPLSFAQQRLWFVDQLEGTSTEYNMVEALRVDGALDRAALTQAVAAIVARHESLRTHFAVVDGEPVQVIAPAVAIPEVTEDLRGQDAATQAAGVEAALQRERETPFDLAQGPLLRLRVVQLADAAHVVLRTCHHIVSDGWSQGVFNHELSTLYAAYRGGPPVTLPPLAVQYADYALWQRQWLDEARLAEGLAYWTTQLAGVPERLLLPMDRPRPPRQTFTAARCDVVVPPPLTAALREVSRAQQATLYMTLLTGLAVLLARYSGQDDLVVGSPIANRQDAQLEALIGFFVNRLVLRVRVAAGATFATLLAQVRQTAFEAYRHQDVPFERVVEELAPQRQLNVTPLTQIGFALQNAPWLAPQLDGLDVEVIRRDQLRVRTDLEIHVDERDGQLSVSWVYSEDLFDRWRIEQLGRHYVNVLAALTANRDALVDQVDFLDRDERQQIVVGWNQTARVVDGSATIVDRFAAQVRSMPDAVAIATDAEQVTYAELDRRADRIAWCLRALGAGFETPVGVCVERSTTMVVSLLGALKAGAAYVPIDPDLPQERQQLLMTDARTSLVLTGSAGASLGRADVTIVNVEHEAAIDAAPPVTPRRGPMAAQAAYVLYTSGSTGRPKGVVVEHRQVINYVDAIHARLGWQPGIHCAMVQPLSVDSSVTVLFGSLLGGGCLYLVPNDTAADPVAFADYCARHAIECLKIAPSHLAALQEGFARGPLPTRWLVVGGEPSRPAWLTALLGQASCEVFNHYGPTETTVGVTMHQIGQQSCVGQTVPVGRPLANVRAYVVGANLAPSPIGVPGELLIGGDCVARGYLNQPAMTAARFVPDWFGTSGARLYRTGDLARWRPDGELEFLGRTDDQIKVRGFRVEPGEIEAALRRAPRVQDALVVVNGEAEAQRLLAYVVRSKSDDEPVVERDEEVGRELQESLRRVLPTYMVPAAVMVVDAWPRTPHGKIDRRALPAPEWTAGAGAEGRAPRTPEEELLCALMADVVGVPQVGPDDDFFALGGHSLLATRLVSRIRATFGVEVAMRTVFETPTVAGIAAQLTAATTPARPRVTPQVRPARLPLSFAQQRLWFVDQLEGTSTEYNMVEAVRVDGPLDRAALRQAVATIVARHESLRTRFTVVDGEPVQVIAPTVAIPEVTEDLRGQDAATQAAGVEAALQRERETPFDLAQGPLLRLRVVQLADAAHVVLRTCHHIVSDGWSQGVFNHELSALYAGYRTGTPVALPPLAVQYADYALWQRRWLDEAQLAEGLAYWTTQLAGVPERLLLPMDRPRPPRQTFMAARCDVVVPPPLTAALRQVSRAQQTTLYMTLLTGLAVLLARYSGQDDLVVGSPIANRQDTQLEGLIGFFVNTLALRVRVTAGDTFATLLAQVRQTALEGYRHQDVPFERVVEALAPQRTLSAPPIFQVMLLGQTAPRAGQQLAGATVAPVRGAALRVRYDLEVHVWERDGALAVGWLYNDQLFEPWRIAQLGRHYGRVLEALAADPQQAVDTVALLTAAERAAVLAPWTAARAAAPGVVPPVVRQWGPAAATDVAIARGAETLTYAALRTEARRIAHALHAAPAAAGELVGIVTDDRVAMVVAILGALEAGWGFAPLDPGLPDERLRVMVAACAPRALLTDAAGVARARAWTAAPVLALEACRADARHDGEALPATDWAAAPCYLYFTSGSTGTPKGVAGRLTSLEQFIAWEIGALQLDATVRVSQLTRPGFDPYLRELFVALGTGGTLCVPPDPELMTDGPRLVAWLAATGVTVLHCVPTVLRILMGTATGQLPQLRAVLSAGEPLLPADVQRWAAALPHTQLVNLYGPTETTLAKCAHWVTAADGARAVVPVGRPLPGAAVVVLDRHDEVCPLGVVGEIGLWTPYASFGYYRQPGATAAAFVPHALGQLVGDRLYRTGDRGRLLPDGTVECLGRQDGQIKIRGHRVELGEIETTLLAQPGVRHVAVALRDGPDGDGRLVAYVVGEGDRRTWRTALQQRLPADMVPSAFVPLDALPLTRHGKVDRRALPAPDWAAQTAEGRAPRTPEEELLCALVADVVGVPQVGPDDDFFALGGHSLLAMHLITRVRVALGADLSIHHLFETPRVGDIADRIQSQILEPSDQPTVPLRPSGDLAPLFCITADRGVRVGLSGLLRAIDKGHPLYVLDAARLGGAGTRLPFEQAAAECLARLREIQPAGPYQLFGGFDAGPIAHAMACALRRDGEEVALLAVLDSRPEPWNTTATTVSHTFDGDLLFVASNGCDPHDTAVPDAWIPYVSGQIKVSWIGTTSLGINWSECCQEVGSVLARELAALA